MDACVIIVRQIALNLQLLFQVSFELEIDIVHNNLCAKIEVVNLILL